jgi:nucleotide-binding universal stress UspA family protein
METLCSILVPIDGSPPSIAALDHAITLALDYGARIDVLHVLPSDDPLSASARDGLEAAIIRAVADARSLLGNRIALRTTSGVPEREIIELAIDERFDMIVIGTHGRVGRLHSLLGSVAEAVVRNAPCPVLTVRDATAGYQSFAERRHGRPTIAEQHQGRPH